MKRFFAGLFAGLAVGALTFWLSGGNVGLSIFVGCMIALIVWFTRAADEIIDWALDLGGTIARALDDIF